MDALQLNADTIGGELSQISDALRAYLEHGIASGRKVQPPRTKAGRDLLQHLVGRLDQVSTTLNEARKHAAPHVSPPPSAVHGPDAPLSSAIPAVSQEILPAFGQQAELPKSQSILNTSSDQSAVPAPEAELKFELKSASASATASVLPPPITAAPSASVQNHPVACQASYGITLSNGAVYQNPLPSDHASPVFDCVYQDIHILNEELFEIYSSHPAVQNLGYFKIQVRDLPPLNVQKVGRPSKDHATSFSYKADRLGLVKVDTGKRFKFNSPHLPLPMSAKTHWSLQEQKDLWNSSAANPPKGTWPYIIGNPLFHDVELSPGEKLRRRGRATLEGINTQYVYFNLKGKTITTMHREDAHVRSENLLRSGEHKFWCFIKPAFGKKLEERMAIEYPEMRRCSQAVRHLSRHIPPAKLDEWGVEYTLDYCVPGQAVVTEPGTYHQVLNLGPNYAIAINLEYNSSPDMPPNYQFCDRLCPDKFAMTAEDFRIRDQPPLSIEQQLPRTPETTGSQDGRAAPALEHISRLLPDPAVSQLTQSATPPPEYGPAKPQLEQAIFERRERSLSVDLLGQGATVPPLPRSQDSIIQPQPPGFPLAAPPIPSPERSVSSTSGPAEQPNFPPQELSKAGVFGLPVQAQSPAPDAVAKSVQIAHPGPSFFQRDTNHAGYLGARMEALPPLRKTARMINPDRKYDDAPSPRPSKKQRVASPSVPVSQDGLVSGAFQHLSTLLRNRETDQAGSVLAKSLCGKDAFDRLAHLVQEWRRYSKSASVVLGRFGLVKSVEETMHGYPELHVFLARFFKMKVAACVESAMAHPAGQERSLPPNFMDGLLQTLEWDETKRPQLHDDLREGKCWATICGEYDGLLCLIASDSNCLDLALFKDELASLHAELDTDFVRGLCGVGAILQKSIWECLELPEFIWESTTTAWLSVERISPLLAPFRLLKSNYYDRNSGFYWPRPAGWHWDWPADPSAVGPGDKLCSFCPRKSCHCAETKIPQIPRISDDGSRGPGVRSVGPHKANDILGELVGELVPPGSCAGNWTIALRRPDLDDVTVADIYPGRMGNWARKVRHSTDSTAMFRMIKISGLWRQMLVAVRDIGDGEEITAKYGSGFLKAQPYSLVEGLH